MNNKKKQIKAQLFPLSLLERFLEFLIERLPRRMLSVDCQPVQQIDTLDQPRGEYCSTGELPLIRISFGNEQIKKGWYYLEAALVRNNGSREAYLTGDGFRANEKTFHIPIPSNLRGTVREVFFLPFEIKNLYFQPTAAAGFFSHSPLLIHKISLLESIVRRMYRVFFDMLEYRHKSKDKNGVLSVRSLFIDLQNAYEYTAKIRLERFGYTNYASYIERNDSLKPASIESMKNRLRKFERLPKFLLVLIARDGVPKELKSSLESIKQQIYPGWEVVISGGFDMESPDYSFVRQFISQERRARLCIKYKSCTAELFNLALAGSDSDYVAEIGCGDVLPIHALFCLADLINKKNNAELVYTDCDCIDYLNRRSNPSFKPDWNPDLLTSYDYISDLCIYSTSKVKAIEGYRSGFEGAERYDLTLRYVKGLKDEQIYHVPQVLYHKRSCAELANENDWVAMVNPDTHEAARYALNEYFRDQDVVVEDGQLPVSYRVRYLIPREKPLVSIIIPTKDKVGFLRKCVNGIIHNTSYCNWEILIVDNGSIEQETAEYFNDVVNDARINVIEYDQVFNYSKINNYAASFAKGEILLFLNNDIEVIDNSWLDELVGHALRPDIGVVGGKLIYSNGSIQHAGVILGIGGAAGHWHRYLESGNHGYCNRVSSIQNLSAVTGACMAMRREVFFQAGGFDPDFAVAFNDIDLCLKILCRGYKNVYTPYAEMYHHESISRGRDDTPEKQSVFKKEYTLFRERWGSALEHDPAYNRNLTLDDESCSFAYRNQ